MCSWAPSSCQAKLPPKASSKLCPRHGLRSQRRSLGSCQEFSPAGLSPQLHSISSAPPTPCLCPRARPEPALEALPAVLRSPLAPADAPPLHPGGLSGHRPLPMQRQPQTSLLGCSFFLTTVISNVNQALLCRAQTGGGWGWFLIAVWFRGGSSGAPQGARKGWLWSDFAPNP